MTIPIIPTPPGGTLTMADYLDKELLAYESVIRYAFAVIFHSKVEGKKGKCFTRHAVVDRQAVGLDMTAHNDPQSFDTVEAAEEHLLKAAEAAGAKVLFVRYRGENFTMVVPVPAPAAAV